MLPVHRAVPSSSWHHAHCLTPGFPPASSPPQATQVVTKATLEMSGYQ